MPRFRYIAANANGQIVRGVLDAPDRATVVDRLHAERQLPLEAVPDDRVRSLWALLNSDFGGRGGISGSDLADFTRELSVMLGAGQDLDRTLRFVVETTRRKRASTVFSAITDKVRDGSSLASALAAHPESFPRLYIGMVRAGEAGGSLGETLDRLSQLIDRERSLRATIQSALVYPAMLVLAAIATIVLLLTYVLPQFTPMFEQAGAQLPAATRALIAFGDLVRGYGVFALLGLIAVVIVVRQIVQQPRAGLAFDRLKLVVPVFGGLIRQVQAARFARTLGTLLINGVSLLSALAIVRDVLGNHTAVQAVEQAMVSVKGGAGLANALAGARVFPLRLLDLLRLGEETGRMPDMALRAAAIHEEQVRQTVQRLVGLLVPIITIVTGLIVSGIIAALVLAMLSLNDLAV